MAKILVTGGAGYVGSHVCKCLHDAGHTVVTFDNLSTGWREAVRFGPLEIGDLRLPKQIDDALQKYRPQAVFHVAALSDIAQSQLKPDEYAEVNIKGTANLLAAMRRAEIGNLVFSSTCAVYREVDSEKLTENSAIGPKNVYGETKLAAEQLIAEALAQGIRSVVLRYFNVAGADFEAGIGEFHRPETHLIPLALQAAKDGLRFTINGGDYDTADGTCVRDYIHATDLARAHLQGFEWLQNNKVSEVMNLGTGRGYSVLEVLRAVEAVTGKSLNPVIEARRAGDCSQLVSGSKKAHELLSWVAERSDLSTMVADAWTWMQTGGYRA